MTEVSAPAFRSIDIGPELSNDTVVPIYLSEMKLRICVARVEGRLYAFGDLCTCDGPSCPLSGGLLTGRTVMCQCHGSCFDVTTGAVVSGPATESMSVYDIQEIDGDIQIRA
jgi:3-phenylpropionate/trans-cinnamate dioxygenase ferredoxin component